MAVPSQFKLILMDTQWLDVYEIEKILKYKTQSIIE